MQKFDGSAIGRVHTFSVRKTDPRMGGVLGGMGPLATVDFLQKVIELTPAQRDQDHVPLIVHQVPQIPDRSQSILAHDDAPLLPLLTGLRRLALAGATFVAIPCNSAHHWYPQLVASQSLPILHIADAVWRELELRQLQSRALGLLATRGTLQSGFYFSRLAARGARWVAAGESTQVLVDSAILAVKAGRLEIARDAAARAAEQYRSSGAEVLILACTELPVVFLGSSVLEHYIDSTLALARQSVAYSSSC
jgi:aspartate racemase